MAAIYMWLVEEQVVLTTTLYPVDQADYMLISGAPVDDTGWWEQPEDFGTSGFIGPGNGTLYLIRFTAPEQGPEDGTSSFVSVGDGVLYSIRFTAPEQGPESGTSGFPGPLNGTLKDVKVIADTPDELLEITGSIEADCSMTAV
jgi:hypothetical protein